MYLLTGKEFDNLRNRVVKLGAKDLQYSRLLNKTYVVTLPNNKKKLILVIKDMKISQFTKIKKEETDTEKELQNYR